MKSLSINVNKRAYCINLETKIRRHDDSHSTRAVVYSRVQNL